MKTKKNRSEMLVPVLLGFLVLVLVLLFVLESRGMSKEVEKNLLEVVTLGANIPQGEIIKQESLKVIKIKKNDFDEKYFGKEKWGKVLEADFDMIAKENLYAGEILLESKVSKSTEKPLNKQVLFYENSKELPKNLKDKDLVKFVVTPKGFGQSFNLFENKSIEIVQTKTTGSKELPISISTMVDEVEYNNYLEALTLGKVTVVPQNDINTKENTVMIDFEDVKELIVNIQSNKAFNKEPREVLSFVREINEGETMSEFIKRNGLSLENLYQLNPHMSEINLNEKSGKSFYRVH